MTAIDDYNPQFAWAKMGATLAAVIVVGVLGAAGKIALLATNPIAAAGALIGLIAILIHQFYRHARAMRDKLKRMEQELQNYKLAATNPDSIRLLDELAVRIRSDFKAQARRNTYFGIGQGVIGFILGNIVSNDWVLATLAQYGLLT
jgi:hypothetical protein